MGSSNLRPMNRLIEKTVLSGLVMAWRLATWPTIRSPVFGLTATTDGVRRAPSALGITTGSPPSITATTELVVPRSMPITLGIAHSKKFKIIDSGCGGRTIGHLPHLFARYG